MIGTVAKEKEYIVNALPFAYYIGFKPFPYQKRFLIDENKRIIWVAGRQVGKTTMTAIKALSATILNDNFTVLTLAPTLRQSLILFDRIREIVLGHPYLARYTTRITRTMLEFKNGSRIFALPSGHTGETIRGYTAQMIIIDEAAYVPEPVYTAITPALATQNGWLILLGTPAGKIGYFWDAWNDPTFSKHHTTTMENPLIDPNFIEEAKKKMTETEFRQELLGEFVEEANTFFPYSLVKRAMVLDPINVPEPSWHYYLGVDVARMGSDETAYVVVRTKDYEHWQMVWYQTTSKKPLTDVAGRILQLHQTWHFRRIYVDETGMGGGVVDMVRERGLPVKGITFTSKQRLELYTNLKLLLEQNRLELLNDAKLLTEFTTLRYEFTSDGNLRIIKDERAHEDIVDALGLALVANIRRGGITATGRVRIV